MPYVSQAQRRFFHSAGARRAGITAKDVKHWDSVSKGRKLPERKRKAKFVVNNKLKKSFGAMNPKTNKIEINLRAHKGDKAELASTIKHELLHVKYPKMTEKQAYKKSAKTKIPPVEQHKLLAKLKRKKINYKLGAQKRKYKLGRAAQKPGTFITKDNEGRKKQVAVRGVV